MSRKDTLWVSYDALTAAAGLDAAACDKRGAFPARAFDRLRSLGLVRNPPLAPADIKVLLRSLIAIGRGDLSVGRIFEGHCNALALIEQYGSASQREKVDHLLAGGAIFGIWNTDAPSDPVTLAGTELTGKKNFASGVDGISHAIITISLSSGRQMLVLPTADLPVDRSWWKPLGMRASGSHIVSFEGIVPSESEWLGSPDDYLKEPWFSGGAVRFSAVQVGGMHALLDMTIAHLSRTKRAQDPHQTHRVGLMGVAVATAYQWIGNVAQRWVRLKQYESAEIIFLANAARVAIERAALDVLELAERSVGAAGMIEPHPLERLMRDLRTYLRQPNPDKALTDIGAALIDKPWILERDA
jgi:alkylation response protein AidB-like acyl-CoA dehydrogenase